MKKYKVVARFKGFPSIDVLTKEFDEESEAKECAKHWKAISYEVEITKREETTMEESLNGRSKSISNH